MILRMIFFFSGSQILHKKQHSEEISLGIEKILKFILKFKNKEKMLRIVFVVNLAPELLLWLFLYAHASKRLKTVCTEDRNSYGLK